MKVYISVDIEGIAGISHWDEATKTHPDYPEFRDQMTREAAAACRGAKTAGAREIWVKDAHDTGRNLIAAGLPDDVRLIRGWSGHPMSMVQELDESFAAVVMIGWHAAAGSEANPLAHTFSGKASFIQLNGEPISEFRQFANAAALVGVPVAFVSGDEGLCTEVQETNRHIATLGVKRGLGDSTNSLSPAAAVTGIEEGVAKALRGDLGQKKLMLPAKFTLEIKYSDPVTAYRMAFYPGAEHAGDRTVRFVTKDYFEVLRMLNFVA